MASTSRFFVTSGTLEADAPSYIERPADGQFIDCMENNEICLVLAPRQMGKSSLLERSRQKLAKRGIRMAVVDFQLPGVSPSPETWFGDIAYRIASSLRLSVDSMKWWAEKNRLGPTTRFMAFLEDVVLMEIDDRVAICFDEVDSALALPFSDDFFTTIRAVANARAGNLNLKRLNFALLGVATPSEFIKDRSRTPFNIGREIELTDFDSASLAPFRKALGLAGDRLVDRILYWTGGQPQMVQRAAKAASGWPAVDQTSEKVDAYVQDAYLNVRIEKERHLQFIGNYLTQGRKRLRRKMLGIYRSVLKGKTVEFDERSPFHSRLQLSGVVRNAAGVLQSRNRIYRRVFDENWAKENAPRDVKTMVAVGATAALAVSLLFFLVIKPLFWPTFGKFQEDIHYTEKDSVFLPIPMPGPADDFRKITVNGRTRDVPDGVEPDRASALKIPLMNLEIGPNAYRIRFYGRLGKGSFEKSLVVVFYPINQQVLPDMEFVEISAGTFMMGSPEDEPRRNDDENLHEVTLTNDFYMQTTEVTQGQWKAVMGGDPSFFKECGDDCPVEQVSWEDVQEFIRRLNRIEPEGKYRLPTETEWEYSARAGTTTPFAFGRCLSTDDANYNGNYPLEGCPEGEYRSKTLAVGSLAANAWGLFDLHGNVYEWCQDWYGVYPNGPVEDPIGPSDGSGRVLRGGSWGNFAGPCRSAYRRFASPGYRVLFLGFRLARSSP